MATIDLGKIKLVWRGTYAGGTAYTVDDVVQHTDSGLTSSFICTTNSTGNAPSTGGSVHGSWAYLAKGGAAGTDVGTTITTQGDLLYRDGSGLQRLAKGTASQVLKMNTAANAPEWGTEAGGGMRFISKHTLSSSTSEWIFDQVFANNTAYNIFQIYIYNLTHTATSDDDMAMDLRKGSSGSESSFRSAHALFYHRERFHGNSGANHYQQTDSAGHGGFRFHHTGVDGGADNKSGYTVVTVFNPHKKDGNGNQVNMKTYMTSNTVGMTDNNGAGSHMYSGNAWGMYDNDDQVATGFSLRPSSNQLRASSGNRPMVLIFGIAES